MRWEAKIKMAFLYNILQSNISNAFLSPRASSVLVTDLSPSLNPFHPILMHQTLRPIGDGFHWAFERHGERRRVHLDVIEELRDQGKKIQGIAIIRRINGYLCGITNPTFSLPFLSYGILPRSSHYRPSVFPQDKSAIYSLCSL